jgi:hypothetical protein
VTWTKLLASRDVQRHRPSKRELDDFRALIARDLADAAVALVSADRRFATAYNAALLAAHMAIAAAGYRVTAKTGHHKVAFDSITLALGPAAQRYADLFRDLPPQAQRHRLHAFARGVGHGGSGDRRGGDRIPRLRRTMDQVVVYVVKEIEGDVIALRLEPAYAGDRGVWHTAAPGRQSAYASS